MHGAAHTRNHGSFRFRHEAGRRPYPGSSLGVHGRTHGQPSKNGEIRVRGTIEAKEWNMVDVISRFTLFCFMLITVGCQDHETRDVRTDRIIIDTVRYSDKEIDGLHKTYYRNGALQSSGIFQNGKANGVVRYYYQNGTLSGYYTYKNGIKNGRFETYYENGQIYQNGNITKNRPSGEILTFSLLGDTVNRMSFPSHSDSIVGSGAMNPE